MTAGDGEMWDFLEDLEAHAASVAHVERLTDVEDRARSAYHEVTVESRLMASVGWSVRLTVTGLGQIAGELTAVGAGWCQVEGHGGEWIVRTPAVSRIRGVCDRSVPEVAWRAVDRLGHRSVLRRVADEGRAVRIHLDDGSSIEAVLLRVGADFIEVRHAGGALELVATDRMVAHRQ